MHPGWRTHAVVDVITFTSGHLKRHQRQSTTSGLKRDLRSPSRSAAKVSRAKSTAVVAQWVAMCAFHCLAGRAGLSKVFNIARATKGNS